MPKLYGRGEATIITGVTGTIRAGGAGNVTGFNATTFWSAVEGYVNFSKTLSYARAQSNSGGSKAALYLGYTDNTESQVDSSGIATFSDLANYGITGSPSVAGSDYIDLTLVYGTGYAAKEITKLYGGVKEPVFEYKISSFANNPGFNPGFFETTWKGVYGIMTKEPDHLAVYSGGTTAVTLVFSNGDIKQLFTYSGSYTNQGAIWGFAQAPANGAATYSSSFVGYDYKARKIVKLYGSVNGSAKLIFEDTNV